MVQRDPCLRKESLASGQHLQLNKDHSAFIWFTHCISLNTFVRRALGYTHTHTHVYMDIQISRYILLGLQML